MIVMTSTNFLGSMCYKLWQKDKDIFQKKKDLILDSVCNSYCIFFTFDLCDFFFFNPTAQDQDETLLEEEIHKASVVCIVYSVIDEDSIQRVSKTMTAFSFTSSPFFLSFTSFT